MSSMNGTGRLGPFIRIRLGVIARRRPSRNSQSTRRVASTGSATRWPERSSRPTSPRSRSRTSSGRSPSNSTIRADSASSASQGRVAGRTSRARLSDRQSNSSQADGFHFRHSTTAPAASAIRPNGRTTTACAAGIGTVFRTTSVTRASVPSDPTRSLARSTPTGEQASPSA